MNHKYQMLEVIGEGAYGIVYKCKNKETGKYVAIKKFKEVGDDLIKKTMKRELKMLQRLHHPNIVQFQDAFKRKGNLFQQFLNLCFDMLNLLGRLVTGNDHAALVDEELGEIPLDVGFLHVVRVFLGKHIVEDVSNGVLHIPAGKAFLLREVLEQRVGIVAIDLHLLEAGELCAEIQLAELMDGLISARGLLAKLVAGEVQDDELLRAVFLIEFLKLLILGSEATLRSRVHDKQNFVGILFQRNILSLSVLDSEIINGFHIFFL